MKDQALHGTVDGAGDAPMSMFRVLFRNVVRVIRSRATRQRPQQRDARERAEIHQPSDHRRVLKDPRIAPT
jgi:hypothetical protein